MSLPDERVRQVRDNVMRLQPIVEYWSEVRDICCELIQLRNAIRNHRSQRADDRCIFDDDKLYAALGDGIKCDRRVGSKEAMYQNCRRYVDQRCVEGGPWVSYIELEAERDRLKVALRDVCQAVVVCAADTPTLIETAQRGLLLAGSSFS